MKVERIASDELTITLAAGDAYRLSQACHAVADLLMGSMPNRADLGVSDHLGSQVACNQSRLFDALGAAFMAGAVAAEDRMEHPVDWARTMRRLGRYVGGDGATEQ